MIWEFFSYITDSVILWSCEAACELVEHWLWGVGVWAWAVVNEQDKQTNWEAPSVATPGSQSRMDTQLSARGPRGAAAAVRWRGADLGHCLGTSGFCSMLTTLWVMLIHGISLFPSSVPTSSLALPVPRVTSWGSSVCHWTDPRQWNAKGLSCSFLWDNRETIGKGGSSFLYRHSKLDAVKTSSACCQGKHSWQRLRPYQDRPDFHQ